MAIKVRVIARRKTGIGNNSLTTANTMIGMNQKIVLAVSPAKNMTPRIFRKNLVTVTNSLSKELYFSLNRATVNP
jgi:ribosomal protein L28